MKPDHHIHTLICEHDCVIVPGLGGFIANRKPAEFSQAKNILYPPSRRIVFNPALVNNDGLLASHIAQEEKIKYETACDEIKNYTVEVFHLLNDGRKVLLEKTGTLQLSPEKNIRFIPDPSQNFLRESFGLAAIHVRAAEHALFDLPERAAVSGEKQKTIHWKILIPAAAVFLFIMMIPKIIPRLNTELGSVFQVTEQKTELPAAQAAEKNISSAATESSAEAASPENTVAEPEAVAPENVPAPETELLKPAAQKKFYIIAGCFRIGENAVKLEAELISNGFDAAIIGKNAAGLTMVSAASYASAEEAKSNLPAFQSKLADGAWVHRKAE